MSANQYEKEDENINEIEDQNINDIDDENISQGQYRWVTSPGMEKREHIYSNRYNAGEVNSINNETLNGDFRSYGENRDELLLDHLTKSISSILAAISQDIVRKKRKGEHKLYVTVDDETSFEYYVIDGKVTNDSLNDLISDLIQKSINQRWIFRPLAAFDLKFGDDPPCDVRNCWYLNNRDNYKNYPGSYEFGYRHQVFIVCDRCKEERTHCLSNHYQSIINAISSELRKRLNDIGLVIEEVDIDDNS